MKPDYQSNKRVVDQFDFHLKLFKQHTFELKSEKNFDNLNLHWKLVGQFYSKSNDEKNVDVTDLANWLEKLQISN